MKSRQTLDPFNNPFSTMLSQFALSGMNAGAHDRQTFSRMSRESGDVALEAAHQLGVSQLILNQQLMALALGQMLSASAALLSLAANGAGSPAVAAEAKPVRATEAKAAVPKSKRSVSATRVARIAPKSRKRAGSKAGTAGKPRQSARR
ncbi:MAG TPA: hypothetical protein VMP00_06105 [Burkholderiales bacterium]|nr:hypothetical protein [Burkholderiales bacterium]